MFKLSSLKRFLSILIATTALVAPTTAIAANGQVVRQDETPIGRELNLPVYEWSDSSVPTKDIIFAIHGATLYARRFEWVAQHLAHEGYPVYALDLRGFGSWRTEGEKFADGDTLVHYGMSEADIVQVLQKIHSKNPDKRIICMGESLGANLAVWVGSNHSDLANGLILVSPCIKPMFHFNPMAPIYLVHGLWNHEWHLPLGAQIKKYLSEDKNVTAEYLSDPMMYHELSAAEFYKSIKTNSLALAAKDKIPATMPVLVIAGQIDRVYQPKAVKPFVAAMGSQRKTLAIIPNRGHLLIEHPAVSPTVLSIIDKWLEKGDTENVASEVKDATADNVEEPSQAVTTSVSGSRLQ